MLRNGWLSGLRKPTCALSLCFFAASASAALAPSYELYSEIGRDAGPIEASATDNSLVAYDSPSYSATAQSNFGINRVFARAIQATGDIQATSVWTDRFTVGATSEIRVSANLTGTNVGGTETEFGGGEYDLLVYRDYKSPAELLFLLDDGGQQGLLHTNFDASGVYDRVLSTSFNAVAGESFYIAGILGVSAYQNQTVDFSRSAQFGITALNGASIVSASGTVYPNAVVPLPSTLALVLPALALLGWVARRPRGAA